MAEAEQLDDVDRILVRELMADGRATLAHLATAAGLSVSAVQSRVRRLESRGVITGYGADQPRGRRPHAVGVRRDHPHSILPNLMMPRRGCSAFPEIESCHSVAGEESYVLLVRVATARALEGLLQRIRTVANVRTRSTIILQTFYDDQVSLPE